MGNESSRRHAPTTESDSDSERPHNRKILSRSRRWLASKANRISSILARRRASSDNAGEIISSPQFEINQLQPDYAWWGEEAEDTPQDGSDSDWADVSSIESFDDISLAGVLECSDRDQINLDIANDEEIIIEKTAFKNMPGNEELNTGKLSVQYIDDDEHDHDDANEDDSFCVDSYHEHADYDDGDSDDEDDEEDSIYDISCESFDDGIEMGKEDYNLQHQYASEQKIDGLVQHLYHFTPKKIFPEFGGSATFTIEKTLDLPILDIVTEEISEYTVASIIVNKTAAREYALQTAGFVECAELIAEKIFEKMDQYGVKQKWKKQPFNLDQRNTSLSLLKRFCLSGNPSSHTLLTMLRIVDTCNES